MSSPALLVRKQSKTNTTSQTTECPKPSSRKGKGREGAERKGQRGWITLKLFLSCSSGWAETTKYRIYQSRWTRKITWTPCSKEQAINEVYFHLPAQKAPKTKLICMSKIQLNKYSAHRLLPFRHVTMSMLSRQVSCLLPACTVYKQDYKVHTKTERASLCGDSGQKIFRRKYACIYSWVIKLRLKSNIKECYVVSGNTKDVVSMKFNQL